MITYLFQKPNSRKNNYQINFILDYSLELDEFLKQLVGEIVKRMDDFEVAQRLNQLYRPEIYFEERVEDNKICFCVDITIINPKLTFEKDDNIVTDIINLILSIISNVDSISKENEEEKNEADEEIDNVEYKMLNIIEKNFIFEIEEEEKKEPTNIEFEEEEIKEFIKKLLNESEIKIIKEEAEKTKIDFKSIFSNNEKIEHSPYIPKDIKKVLRKTSEVQKFEIEQLDETDVVSCVYSFDPRNTPKMYEMQIIKIIMYKRFLDKLRTQNSLVYYVSQVDYVNMEYIVFYTEVEKHKTDLVIKLCNEVEEELYSKNISEQEFKLALNDYYIFSNSRSFLEIYKEQLKQNIVADIETRTFRKKVRKLKRITLSSVINEIDRIEKIAKIKFIGVD